MGESKIKRNRLESDRSTRKQKIFAWVAIFLFELRGRGAWAASLPAGVVEAEAVDGRRERARVDRLEGLKPTVVLQQLLDHVLLHL